MARAALRRNLAVAREFGPASRAGRERREAIACVAGGADGRGERVAGIRVDAVIRADPARPHAEEHRQRPLPRTHGHP